MTPRIIVISVRQKGEVGAHGDVDMPVVAGTDQTAVHEAFRQWLEQHKDDPQWDTDYRIEATFQLTESVTEETTRRLREHDEEIAQLHQAAIICPTPKSA